MLRILFLFSILCFGDSDAARILAAFPVPSISHQVVFRSLTQELARIGHDITTDPAFPKDKAPPNFKELDVHNISYTFFKNTYKVPENGWKNDPITLMKQSYELFVKFFEVQLQDDEVQKLIKEEYFDLVLVEAGVRSAYVLSHIFKAPMILISSAGASTGIFDMVGAPTHPILYPSIIRQRIYNLSLWEKVQELYRHFVTMRNYYGVDEMVDDMLRKHFGHSVPTVNELRNNVDVLFLNTHPVLEGNHPVPPNVKYVWGLHQKPEKDLPKDLKSYLDSSQNGVIYMSFGTNVHPSMVPKEKVDMIIRVLSQLSYDVLWKWDGEVNNPLPGNVQIGKWFPQSDLLRHPKLKLFITQGGLQSTDEAITAGVPLIGIPMAADQWYNTEKYVHHKFGVQLDMGTIEEDQFRNAVTLVIEDKSYRNNIVKLRALLQDQPMSGLERAVWWTEHVLRHGGARHLRAPAANISWAEYLMLDFFLTIAVIIFSICFVLCWAVKKIFNRKSDKVKIS